MEKFFSFFFFNIIFEMGLIDKLKSNYDYYKVDKFTKRRLSQSQFESHDRQYYEQVYRDGDYLSPDSSTRSSTSSSRSHLQYKNPRWSISGMLKKSNKKPLGSTANQLKTSEAYNLGYSRD